MPCRQTETRCGKYHGRLIERLERGDNLVAIFPLGLVFGAKIVSMGGVSHVAKGLGNKDDEENEGFKLKVSKNRDVSECRADTSLSVECWLYVFTVSHISLFLFIGRD